jgi:alkylhydroperoxidase/carboxymuconolactone decarboxylase family protein YurZ
METFMSESAKQAFDQASLGAQNTAYEKIARMDPEYFEKLKGLYVDATFGREGALPRKIRELIMVGITCALNRPRGVRLHSERALALGATPREVLEAMETAAIPGGMPGLWLGVETLDEILQRRGIALE